MRVARRRGRGRREFERHPRRILRQDDEPTAPGPLEADRGRVLVALRPGDAAVMIRAAPRIVGGPGSRGRDLQNPPPVGARDGADDEQVVGGDACAAAILRRESHSIGSRRPILAHAKLQRRLPPAPHDGALLRRVLPPCAIDAPGQHRRGDAAVANDRHLASQRRRTHEQTHGRPGRVRERIRICPDLAEFPVHSGSLVAMSKNRLAPLLGAETEVRKAGPRRIHVLNHDGYTTAPAAAHRIHL